MSSLAFLWPTAACAITGLALYVTRGVLDQTVTASGIVRFAMLPPWQALVGFMCLAALVLVGIDHLNAPTQAQRQPSRPRLSELVLPLLSLAILLLPFVPFIPDRWPVVQALAGPLGAIVWLAVAALQLWTMWQSRLITARASSDGASGRSRSRSSSRRQRSPGWLRRSSPVPRSFRPATSRITS